MNRKADVVIPVFADVRTTRDCIESVFGCAGPELGQVIVINDCSPEPQMQSTLRELEAAHREMILISNEANLGFVRSANRGMGLRRGDVVLLNSDAIVTPGWLSEMLEVAYANDRVAAVVPLSNNAAICSVPSYCQPSDMRELAGRELQLESLPRHTIVPTGVGFCLLMKHLVLNMIGGFDAAYGRGYNEENDWAMRAQTLGFIILRANRALVYHLGTASFGGEREELDRTNTSTLLNRYPYFLDEVSAFSKRAEARIASSYVRRRVGTTSVCINARHLDSSKVHDTEVYALQLAKNLKEHTDLEVVGLANTPDQERLLAEIGIESRTREHSEREQIFHHPTQIFDSRDFDLFLSAPGHAVITFHDLIAWRTPSAHRSIDHFEQYVAMCFAALQSAQAVIAGSNYNRDEIVREFHLPPERVQIVYPGVDPTAFEARTEGDDRSRLEALGLRKPFFLYAGSDHAHKNLKLLLTAYALFKHRFRDGTKPSPELVLIGAPSRSVGSMYDRDEAWPPGVRYLGALDGADVRLVYRAALAFVFPSAYEGFGLPVLEAMAAGIPLVCSSLTSLPELAGDAALYIKDFSPEEIAHLMLKVATSTDVRRSLVREGRGRVKKFTWRETARKTAAIYENIIEHPTERSLFHRSMFWNFLRTTVENSPSSSASIRILGAGLQGRSAASQFPSRAPTWPSSPPRR